MSKNILLPTVTLLFFIALTAFKPPKNTFPKNDILYSKYGGDVDLMMREERIKDSLAHPYLYVVKAEKVDTLSYDDESVIVEKAQIMPLFPDGEQGMKDYISSATLLLPDTLVGKKANVIVKFYVNFLGNAKDAKIVKTDNPSFDLHTIMLVENMPKWTPGKTNGKEVNCYVTMPIKF